MLSTHAKQYRARGRQVDEGAGLGQWVEVPPGGFVLARSSRLRGSALTTGWVMKRLTVRWIDVSLRAVILEFHSARIDLSS